MKSLRSSPLPRWFARVSPGLLSLGAGQAAQAAAVLPTSDHATSREETRDRFGFAYDGVLGTSLDARLSAASARDARECEQRILAEIDRVEKILSPHDPASEFNRVRAGGSVESPELAEVLAAYELWSARTHGALHANLAAVTALWRDAARSGREPSAADLAAAFASPRSLAIDALGKAYIVDRAVAMARPFASSGLLNVGGDLRAWGDQLWMIDVANPFAPAENAAPLVQIPLRNAAAATSGGYARNFAVGAQRHSHLIDPRSLRPLATDRAATVVATDCVSANALSTALCVLDAREASAVARAYAFDALRIGGSGEISASRGFGSVAALVPAKFAEGAAPVAATAVTSAWPSNFEVSIGISLRAAANQGRRVKRPYVAVWVEDASHQLVRTITVWGNEGRYLSEMTNWWQAIGGNRREASSVTRATRAPGAYTVTWDGRDNRGEPVPQGDYMVFVEINREHGRHVWESATISCGSNAATAEIRDTPESDAGAIAYGPRRG
jgi:thiamine biosynthesis lipoprotein ApbE